MSEVKEALLNKGYVYIGIGIRVTGNIQTNDRYSCSLGKKIPQA